MGLDYETFGTLLAQYGKGKFAELEHVMQN